MGDISIIARRLKDGHVQYGWSGNGGYFTSVGVRLLLWYQKPEDVEYLFELGQTRLIGKKGSEKGGFGIFESHDLTGEAFWLGRTERVIFSRIMFIDYGYFYDLDHKWYYIIPGPFRIKMPLELIENHLNEENYEFEYLEEIEDKIIKYILNEYRESHPDFMKYVEKEGYYVPEVMKDEDIKREGRISVMRFYDKYRKIFKYFDDWILIKTNNDDTEITDIVVKKKSDDHIETCEW